MRISHLSNELEAFREYISVTRALRKKSVEAYKGDLSSIENELQTPLINLESKSILEYFDQALWISRLKPLHRQSF
mgnify:CR=1 FL=1